MKTFKKQAQQIQSKFDKLLAENETIKKTSLEKLESVNNKCTNAEQKLLDAQKIIAELESELVTLKQENETSLKDLQGMYSTGCCPTMISQHLS